MTGFYKRDGVCSLRDTNWIFIHNSDRQFNIHKLHVLPTQCI